VEDAKDAEVTPNAPSLGVFRVLFSDLP
jgi:hypothetical protein